MTNGDTLVEISGVADMSLDTLRELLLVSCKREEKLIDMWIDFWVTPFLSINPPADFLLFVVAFVSALSLVELDSLAEDFGSFVALLW
jgi:hypothetical protein